MALGVGIVGAGKHGERYLRHVADVPELRLVAHTLRFNAVVGAVRAALATIGPLHAAVLTQRFEPSTLAWLDTRAIAGGGIVLHTGVHSFDLLRHLTGDDARRVSAHTGRVAT